MSASTSSNCQGVVQQRPARQSHRESNGRVHEAAVIPEEGDEVENAFWMQLEEREEGQLALEADHLFDTSYAWAA